MINVQNEAFAILNKTGITEKGMYEIQKLTDKYTEEFIKESYVLDYREFSPEDLNKLKILLDSMKRMKESEKVNELLLDIT